MLEKHLLNLPEGKTCTIEKFKECIQRLIKSFKEKNFDIMKSAADMWTEHKVITYKAIFIDHQNYLIDQIREFNKEIFPKIKYFYELKKTLKDYLND